MISADRGDSIVVIGGTPRDRCQWTDAGEHADQGSKQDTDEAYEERSRRERLAEAQEDPVQDFHMRARRKVEPPSRLKR